MDSVVEIKQKKERWRVFVILDIAFLFILIGVGLILYNHYNQEQTFISEIEKVVQKNFRTDEFVIDTQTSGDYGIIEEQMKRYFLTLAELIQSVEDLEETDILTNILTSENLKADGPSFEQSFKKIIEVRETVQKSIQNFTDISTKEYMTSLISNYSLDEGVVDLFWNLIEKNDVLKRLEVSKDYFIETGKSFELFLNDYEEILSFLSKNKGQWVIDGDSIVFRTTELLAEYQNLSQKLVDDSNF